MKTNYTKDELKILESELEVFRIHKTLRDGSKITYCDSDAYLISKGIFAKGRFGYGPGVVETQISALHTFEDKLSQLQTLKGKREYAQKMERES